VAIVQVKQEVKNIFSFDLIDVKGTINTKGNYIYLTSTQRAKPLMTRYTFCISIIGHSLIGSKTASLEILEQALQDIYNYEINSAINLDASSRLVEFGELLGYEITLSIVAKTKAIL